MKRSFIPVILVMLALAFNSASISASNAKIETAAFLCDGYSGQMTTDTSWNPTDCPTGYTISGNVLVQPGITLTILPGTLVKFSSGPTLTIEGTLIARGTAAQPIVFTSNQAIATLSGL